MDRRYRTMVLMQAGLGLRVDDVDFLRRTVRVEHQADPDTLDLVPPKTVRSRRTIPLPEVVANALAAHLAAYPPDELTGCACPAPTTCSRTRSGLLFHTSTSRPYSHDHYGGRVFPRAVTAAGLPPGTSTYDLRHHFASLPQMRGVASDATFDGSCDWAATRTWGFRLIGVAV
jgi:integrase